MDSNLHFSPSATAACSAACSAPSLAPLTHRHPPTSTHTSTHPLPPPVFVSDVQPKDLQGHIDWLATTEPAAGGAMAARLNAALDDGRLAVEAPEFYTGALPFWEMPSDVSESYERAAVVITKGDANYRRLLGDLHWQHDYSFSELTGAYWPKSTGLAALRTCKSGVLVGVEPSVEAAAAAAHPDKWLVAGLYGCVQLKPAE